MLTLLTATGCRPEAWAICEQLMMRQTYAGPVHWIVVDDGEDAQPVTFQRDGWRLTVVRPEHRWKQGANTQAQNMAAGLALVEADAHLVIIEDDDAYAPDWLETMATALLRADLAGENYARYYNIKTRVYRQLQNAMHASLCATGMRGAALETFRAELKSGVQFIDLNLWRNFRGRKVLFGGNRVTGIKGLPGRDGIGIGHKPDFRGTIDRNGAVLKSWAGVNSDLYEYTVPILARKAEALSR